MVLRHTTPASAYMTPRSKTGCLIIFCGAQNLKGFLRDNESEKLQPSAALLQSATVSMIVWLSSTTNNCKAFAQIEHALFIVKLQ